MIDIHTHIIPGVDDGSDNMEDSLAMVRMAAECGVTSIIATPHCNMEGYYDNYHSRELVRAYKNLEERVKGSQIPVAILLGMEIFYTPDLPQKIEEKTVIGLNDSRYYLIEFPFDVSARRLQDSLYTILEMGKVVPVIAHPERYYCVQHDPQVIYKLVMEGCVTQVNKGSIAGKFGREPFCAAMELLEYNLAGCVASDAHTPYMRTTHMEGVYSFLAEEYSPECARLLLCRNPEKIMNDRKLDMRACARSVRKRYFR